MDAWLIFMPQTIHKKCFPEYFESLNKGRNADIRLQDFRIGKGDLIIFEEWDPKTNRYTGRKIAKKCKGAMPYNPTRIYTMDKIAQFGLVLIELEDNEEKQEYDFDEKGQSQGRVKTWADIDEEEKSNR